MTAAPLDLTVEGAEEYGIDPGALRELALALLRAEGIVGPCALGIAFAGESEMRALNAEHRALDEVTDVLAFPLDGRDELPPGVPRQLGDAVLCPQVVGDEWRRPLVHALLHLLGYGHGAEMDRKEGAYS
jgi:rRNA maturation RNase YbeY